MGWARATKHERSEASEEEERGEGKGRAADAAREGRRKEKRDLFSSLRTAERRGGEGRGRARRPGADSFARTYPLPFAFLGAGHSIHVEIKALMQMIVT